MGCGSALATFVDDCKREKQRRCTPQRSVQRVQVVHAQSAAPLLQPTRRFEADLDFTARLSLLCRLICVFLPPLTFWLIAAIFQGTVKPDTVLQRLLKPLWYDTGDSWMRLTWTLVKLTGLLIGSVAASILLRYQLRERQVCQRAITGLYFTSTQVIGEYPAGNAATMFCALARLQHTRLTLSLHMGTQWPSRSSCLTSPVSARIHMNTARITLQPRSTCMSLAFRGLPESALQRTIIPRKNVLA